MRNKTKNNLSINKIDEIHNKKNMNIYIKYPDSTNSNISNNNISYEKLPSNQRNNAYGNSHNRINNFKKEKEKNYYMIQFPRKEEPQNINLKSNINPKRNIIDTIDTVNENSESEIKSIKDKARKKYQSSSVERNSHNYSQNNTAPRLEKAPINNYERIQTYQKINFNNNNLSSLNNTNNTNTNSTVI